MQGSNQTLASVAVWCFAGTLVWSPLLSAVALAVLQPTKAEIQRQQDEAVQQVWGVRCWLLLACYCRRTPIQRGCC